jgi:hypothetical protein
MIEGMLNNYSFKNLEIMAKQKGIIKLKGTMGDITFYKTRDGYMAREKGGIDAHRIATDPHYQRTRENMSEFGRAGKGTKLVRQAFNSLTVHASDGGHTSRLMREMSKVVKADLINPRGLRNVIDGEAELLTGFEFNINGKFGSSLRTQFQTEINRVTGKIKLDIASFIPANAVFGPIGATHFKIVSSGAEIDFENETYISEIAQTDVLPWDITPTVAIAQVSQVTANSTHPLFLVVGILFYQEVNGVMYPLKNGAFNPLAIVKVDSGV